MSNDNDCPECPGNHKTAHVELVGRVDDHERKIDKYGKTLFGDDEGSLENLGLVGCIKDMKAAWQGRHFFYQKGNGCPSRIPVNAVRGWPYEKTCC